MSPLQLSCIICSSKNFTYPSLRAYGNSEGKGVAQNNAISAWVGGSKTGELSKTNSCSVKQAIS